MAILSVIWAFVRGIPWQVYVAIAIVTGIYSYGKHCEHVGEEKVMVAWKASNQLAQQMADENKAKAESEIAGVGLAFAEQASKQRVITQTIIQKVTEYVPSTDPVLSGGFRLLHDAAATGKAPDDSSRANAAPVASADAATTIAQNYAACRSDQDRLEALQKIVNVLNAP